MTQRAGCRWLFVGCLLLGTVAVVWSAPERLRLIVETDLGGDPDDEQSMVRFLLYANEWDVEGIIANRPHARDGENRNPERTGLGIARRFIDAYAQCHSNLVQNDSRYPTAQYLRDRTVPGYDDIAEGVNLILRVVDDPDRRPVWFLNWGTDRGAAISCLTRALDQVRRGLGEAGYARFKQKLRLSSSDEFAEHTFDVPPPFPIWVDTFRPELNRRRWYHRFSAVTAKAGGFDLARDVLSGHGPLGALYPTNTTHWQKEGDTMTFLYLVPTGMNNPMHPEWGSWAGRYAAMTNTGANYFWATAVDAWNGTTNRENTLARWAADLQNDFRARLNWCVHDFAHANHPPTVEIVGGTERRVRSGDAVLLDASASSDSDNQALRTEWIAYPEVTGYDGPAITIRSSEAMKASFTAPRVEREQRIHIIAAVADNGTPPLTRYARIVVTIQPK